MADAWGVARRLVKAIRDGEGASLLRFGDTGGRVLATPDPGTPEWIYLVRFLGAAITPERIEWLGDKILESAARADVVGLRTDLLAPPLPPGALALGDQELRELVLAHFPIRPYDRDVMSVESARRLAETRIAMDRFAFRPDALLTDAWIHVGLAEIGFFSALMRRCASVALVTSSARKALVSRLVEKMPGRLRYYECPAYPWEERRHGADHGFLWDRWRSLVDVIAPARPGEPLLISAGIWTKPIATAFRERGGVAVDFGSVMDYMDNAATRPAVLADRYGVTQEVPEFLTLDAQFARTELLADFF